MTGAATILILNNNDHIRCLLEAELSPFWTLRHASALSSAIDLVENDDSVLGAIIDLDAVQPVGRTSDSSNTIAFAHIALLRRRCGVIVLASDTAPAVVNEAFVAGIPLIAKGGLHAICGRLTSWFLAAEHRLDQSLVAAVHDFARLHSLPERSIQVLIAALNSQEYKEIATSLGISPHTVRDHVRRVLRACGAAKLSEVLQRIRSVG